MNNQAKLQFFSYVKRKYPVLYNRALMKMNSSAGLSGLGITVEEMLAEQNAFAEPQSGGIFSNITDILNNGIETIKNLAPTVIGYQQAKTCIDVNATRAKAGQPPIDCNSVLTPQVNVGVSKEMQYLMYAVVGLGALYLFTKKR